MDVLNALSLARTALDDPSGLPEDSPPVEDRSSLVDYAIDKIDEAIGLLDVEDHPGTAIKTLALLMAEAADVLEAWEHPLGTAWSDGIRDGLDHVNGVLSSMHLALNAGRR